MAESNAKEASVNKPAETQAVKGDALASATASVLASIEKITTSQSPVSFSSSPNAEMPSVFCCAHDAVKVHFLNQQQFFFIGDLQLMPPNEPVVSSMFPLVLVTL